MKRLLILLFYCVACCLTPILFFGQNGLTKGAPLPQLPVNKVLNDSGTGAPFAVNGNKLTIVDFFGTWCVPCLRALPQLAAIQQAFKEDVRIVLVSNEQEAQLTRFITKRQPFPFPVVVDEGNRWNAAFQPPSLPYTVVIKDNKVVAITEAAQITSAAVQSWLQTASSSGNDSIRINTKPALMAANNKSSNAAVRLSQDYLYQAKTGASTQQVQEQLSARSYAALAEELRTDNEKKAFWINIYNGYTQTMLQTDPEQYKKRNSFFKKRGITIAGARFSLDEIEHGILRRSKSKWSLGYWNKLFPSRREKTLRVAKVDYRIHFALNCGAKSCPPIAFYNDAQIENQLDIATKAYLSGEARYDTAKRVVYLPKLMSWFRGDFGGKNGMKQILKQIGIVPSDVDPKIRFLKYDWTLTLNNYTNQPS